jgi:hypothetical protein
MNLKDRLMSVLRHEEPDAIPITAYTILAPRGYKERQLRNMGLCLVDLSTPVYGFKTPNVTMETTEHVTSFSLDDRYSCVAQQKQVIDRTYNTPVGTIREKYKRGYALFEWPSEWAIKDLRDYQTVKCIIDDTEYFPNYDDFSKVERIMGDDGVAAAMTPKSPLQSMLLDLMGYTRFSLDYRMHRAEFDDLYQVFRRKQLEMYRIVADSPAEIVLLDDNINGVVTSPKLFEDFCVPFYDEIADMLHAKGKILAVHLDGKLKCLRDLIARTKIDVVEAFTPPPIGDISIDEARATWKGKVLWTNFPATVSLEAQLDRVEREVVNILQSAAPGHDFALGITEDIGDIKSMRYLEVLETITKTVAKHGTYPIAKS